MFTANFALERLLASVEVLVLNGVCTDREGLVTNLTLITRGTFVSSNVHLNVVPGSVSVRTDVAIIFAILAMVYGMQRKCYVIFISVTTNITLYWFIQFNGWWMVASIFRCLHFRKLGLL